MAVGGGGGGGGVWLGRRTTAGRRMLCVAKVTPPDRTERDFNFQRSSSYSWDGRRVSLNQREGSNGKGKEREREIKNILKRTEEMEQEGLVTLPLYTITTFLRPTFNARPLPPKPCSVSLPSFLPSSFLPIP